MQYSVCSLYDEEFEIEPLRLSGAPEKNVYLQPWLFIWIIFIFIKQICSHWALTTLICPLE